MEVHERIKNESLLPTDEFYDEDTSDWFPLSELSNKQAAAGPKKAESRVCYCGSGLPFPVCCGNSSSY